MPDIDVTPKKWMEDPLYFKRQFDGEWEKLEGTEVGRTAALLVLPDGNVFDVGLGTFREQFDPVKMRDIAKLFEPLPEGLGDDQTSLDQPDGE